MKTSLRIRVLLSGVFFIAGVFLVWSWFHYSPEVAVSSKSQRNETQTGPSDSTDQLPVVSVSDDDFRDLSLSEVPSAENELAIALGEITKTSRYREYVESLRQARLLGTRESLHSCLIATVILLQGTLPRYPIGPDGTILEPQVYGAIGRLLGDIERDLGTIPGSSEIPGFTETAERLLIWEKFMIGGSALHSPNRTPDVLKKHAMEGASVADLADYAPGVLELYIPEEERAFARDSLLDDQDDWYAEDPNLARLHRFFSYMANLHVNTDENITFTELATILENPALALESREEAMAVSLLDATVHTYLARRHRAWNQEWSGPGDIIPSHQRGVYDRGYPISEALYRLNELRREFGGELSAARDEYVEYLEMQLLELPRKGE